MHLRPCCVFPVAGRPPFSPACSLSPPPPTSFKKQTLCSLHLLGSSVLVYLGNILMIERPTHHFFFFCKIQNKGKELEKVKTTLWVVYAQRKSELEPELGSP